MISHQLDIDKIYSCAKDPYKEKYQYLINKWERSNYSLNSLYKIKKHKKNGGAL